MFFFIVVVLPLIWWIKIYIISPVRSRGREGSVVYYLRDVVYAVCDAVTEMLVAVLNVCGDDGDELDPSGSVVKISCPLLYYQLALADLGGSGWAMAPPWKNEFLELVLVSIK